MIENNGKPPPVSSTPAMMVNQTLCVSGKRDVDRTDILETPSGLALHFQAEGGCEKQPTTMGLKVSGLI